jgi:uncharacterized protein involved in response to NO
LTTLLLLQTGYTYVPYSSLESVIEQNKKGYQIHTGRHLKSNILINISIFLIIFATFIRALIPFFSEYAMIMYLSSSIIWALPFIIYSVQFFGFLVKPRIDGIAG